MILRVNNVSHAYEEEEILADVSFNVEAGELIAILGPSGCGKTTLVQSIAGHNTPTTGSIHLRETDVTNQPPENREIGLMFQQPTLYPHMTVGENIEYGLLAKDYSAIERDEIIDEMLQLVALNGYRDTSPNALSVGQQRRAELARALAPKPDLLLLDEPLASLDRSLRDKLLSEISRIQRETNVTTVFVTHDQEEAMAVADRLIVMNDGNIAGVGTPRSLYTAPPTQFVASFLGQSSRLSGKITKNDPLTISIGELTFEVNQANGSFIQGDNATCFIRPEQVKCVPVSTDSSVNGTVAKVTDRGRYCIVTVELATGETIDVESRSNHPKRNDQVKVEVVDTEISVFS